MVPRSSRAPTITTVLFRPSVLNLHNDVDNAFVSFDNNRPVQHTQHRRAWRKLRLSTKTKYAFPLIGFRPLDLCHIYVPAMRDKSKTTSRLISTMRHPRRNTHTQILLYRQSYLRFLGLIFHMRTDAMIATISKSIYTEVNLRSGSGSQFQGKGKGTRDIHWRMISSPPVRSASRHLLQVLTDTLLNFQDYESSESEAPPPEAEPLYLLISRTWLRRMALVLPWIPCTSRQCFYFQVIHRCIRVC